MNHLIQMKLTSCASSTFTLLLLLVIIAQFYKVVTVETEFACERHPIELQCETNEGLTISNASYGHWGPQLGSLTIEGCQLSEYGEVCHATSSLEIVQAACEGQRSCQILASNNVFGDPCQSVTKFLWVQFICTARCSEDWTYANGYCYYFLDGSSQPFTNARESCMSLDADLTSIHSSDENGLISDLSNRHSVWIGLTDVDEEGIFSTWTDGSSVTFTRFHNHDGQSDRKDCVYHKGSSVHWKWSECSSNYRSVCKKASIDYVTTQHSFTSKGLTTDEPSATTDKAASIVTTPRSGSTTVTIDDSFIQLEMFLLADEGMVSQDTYGINASVLVRATLFGSFLPSLPLAPAWSVADCFSGDSVHYTHYSLDSILVHFPSPSKYTATVTATDPQTQLAASANATVVPSTALYCSTVVFVGEEAWCALLVDVAVEYGNFTVTFGEDMDTEVSANPRDWSLDELPAPLVGSALSFYGMLACFISHIYADIGANLVTAILFEKLVSQTEVVVETSCIGSLQVIEGYGNHTHPAEHRRSADIAIAASLHLNPECLDPMTSTFTWRILTSTEDGNIAVVFQEITRGSQVTIPRHSLSYGDYDLTLQAQTMTRASEEMIGEKHATTRLRILASPLVAIVAGGLARSQSITSPLLMDGSMSHDPDGLLGSGDLSFSWYCVLLESGVVHSTLDEALQNHESPCFEDEGVVLDSESMQLAYQLDMSLASKTLNMWLTVSGDGRSSASAQQRITLTQGVSPQMQIECVSNCGTYINTAERLVLHASCTNCGDEDEVSFTWELGVTTGHQSGISLASDWSAQTTTGLDQAYMGIKPSAYASVTEAGSALFRVTGQYVGSTTAGFAEYSIEFNAAPVPGSCDIDPGLGYALHTTFTIACPGFTDVDTPLSYQIFAYTTLQYVDGELHSHGEGFQLYSGSHSEVEDISLPIGDAAHNHTVLLKVVARDIYQASTALFINVTVHPPELHISGGNASELLNVTSSVESKVKSLVAGGDISQATQLISALGSVLNVMEEGEGEGAETRTEIRSHLLDNLAAIEVESMVSLRQSSAALSVVTSNENEITTDMQVKAAETLNQMTSFLKAQSESDSEGQGSIETAGTILVEGLSNILGAANAAEKRSQNKTTSDHTHQAQNQTNKNLTDAALSAIADIQDALVIGKVASEEATVISSPALSIAVSRVSSDRLQGASLGGAGEGEGQSSIGGFSMPRDANLGQVLASVNETDVNLQMSSLKWNPFSWGPGGDTLNSSVVGIQLKAAGHALQVQNLSSDLSVYIPIPSDLTQEFYPVAISKDVSASLPFNASSLPALGGALHLTILSQSQPLVALSICMANISINSTDCLDNSTIIYVTQDESSDRERNFTWSVSTEHLIDADGIKMSLYEGPSQPQYERDNISLSVSIHTSQCVFWDQQQQIWDHLGCKVGPLSTLTTTQCLCSHLSFFGSSLLVPPNKINVFGDAKLFLTFVENPIVVTFVGVILVGFVGVVVLARRKDKRDTALAQVIVLEDNDPFHHYRYDVTVVTGMRRGAGTTATVTLTLIGSDGRSEPHVLSSKDGSVLTRGSNNSFLLTTARSLGEIQGVRLWHNNTGKSPQWYVNNCTVHDLESDERYYIIAAKWLMIGGEGAGLDKTFRVASEKQLHQFGLLLTSRTIRDLRDGHLWLSVVTRPKHSHFSCVQRVSCCLSLLMSMMMTSIMFYGVPSDPADQVMDFGTFRITLKEIIIGIESSVIAFPINLVIVLLFRHARPREKHQPDDAKIKYVVDESRELSGPPSNAESNLGDLESGFSLAPDIQRGINTTTSKSTSCISIVDEEKKKEKQSSECSGDAFTDCEESVFTSSVDHAPSQSGACAKESSSSSSYASVGSDSPSRGRLEPRSISDVMSDWGCRRISPHRRVSTSGNLQDARSLSKEGKDNSHGNVSMDENRGDSLIHNLIFYTNVLEAVSELKAIISERFCDPEVRQQAQAITFDLILGIADLANLASSSQSQETVSSIPTDDNKSKQKGLPYPCVYLAWLLVFLSVLASSYITMLYGLKYGRQGSIDWLVSLVISLFQSIFVTQPLKVLFFAIFLSLIFKQLEPEEDFSDDIQEQEVLNAKEVHSRLLKRRHTLATYLPPAQATIDTHLHSRHLKERMYSLLWQIAGFLCFFYLLMIITYSQRDRQAYYLTTATKGLFFSNKDYILMNDFRSLVKWADSTLLPGLLDEERWGAEKQSTLIGGGLRFRQVRVNPSSCEIDPLFEGKINDCRAVFSSETEDKQFYNGSWSRPLVNTSGTSNFNLSDNAEDPFGFSPWQYNHDSSMSMWGYTATYPGCGYVWVLGDTLDEAKEALAELVDARWMDQRTRALFVEWTSYNANTNLFCVVTFLLETPASAGLLKKPEIQSVRLHRYAANYKLFIILCEILFVLCLWFVMYREYVRYKPIGLKKYLSDKWNWLELAIIANCYASAGLYIYRSVVTSRLFQEMRKDTSHYVSFRLAAEADNQLGYSLAFMIILSSIKFLYLLRLNPRMYLLTAVISECLREVTAFTILLFVLIMCYALPMQILFATLPNYQTIGHALVTLSNSLPGNFVYEDLAGVHRHLGPLVLLSFQYWACFLYLDLLISALQDSMVYIRREPPPPSDNRKLGLMLLSKIFSLLGIPEKYHLEIDDT